MGMFDNVIVDVKILPDLTEDERIQLNVRKGWQTKDFENTLTDVYIVEDDTKFKFSFTGNPSYKLQIKKYNYETVPREERPFPDAPEDSMDAMFGSMREANINVVDSDYTGRFAFYTYLGDFNNKTDKWYEFIGQSEKGKIISIKRLTD